MKFEKEFMQELAWGDHDADTEIISDEITDTTRWSIHNEQVFRYKDKFYVTYYSKGATEQQDERPYEYEDDEIECAEVFPIEETRIVYKPIAKKE